MRSDPSHGWSHMQRCPPPQPPLLPRRHPRRAYAPLRKEMRGGQVQHHPRPSSPVLGRKQEGAVCVSNSQLSQCEAMENATHSTSTQHPHLPRPPGGEPNPRSLGAQRCQRPASGRSWGGGSLGCVEWPLLSAPAWPELHVSLPAGCLVPVPGKPPPHPGRAGAGSWPDSVHRWA